MQKKSKQNQKNSQITNIRIISGRFRGRKLPVLHFEGLRPTGDRLRETLFNWLNNLQILENAKVLDAFAGAGSLGFEALSRGASEVVFLEKNKQVALQISKNIQAVKSDNAFVKNIDTLDFLSQKNNENFDLVFLDPPFHHGLGQNSLSLLLQNDYVSENTIIYLEMEKEAVFNVNDFANLSIIKEQNFGNVSVRLLQFNKIGE